MPSDRDSSSAARGSGRTNPNFTTTVITRNVGHSPSRELYPGSVATTKHEERTTCRRVVNHKTKQVETRVQRQLVYEDGKIIADSGPQITTKTTEDSRTEEFENTDNKNLGNDPVYKFTPGTSRVISEKTETRQVLKENKEESMQLRNETFHELTGPEFHQKALMSPDNALFIITDDIENNQSYPGKVVHYSCHSQKITDKEEVKEVSELKDGELKTETTRTHHHEEQEDDEVPEDEVDESALPEISKETIKNIEYYKDDGEFESLKEKLRRERDNNIIRENLKGRNKPITKKTPNFDEEEVIKNSETNRWLENHFGSDSGSDVAEPIRTKAGGNVINIQMTASPRSASREKLDPDHEVKYKEEYTFSNRQVQDHNVPSISKLFQDNRPLNKNLSRVKDWHTSLRRLPESHSSHSSVLPRSSSPLIVRESAESPTIPETFLKTATTHRQMLASSKIPAKKYFLGDNGTYEQHYTKYEPQILKKQSLGWKSTPSITDDYVHGLEDKVKHVVYKQKNVRYEQRSPERSVQRSHPPTEVPKNSQGVQ
ncbi:uncharacterized protein LOC111084962 [Limulus polyphemus]|uniref:Uncharacterized protein LOC111084962 n=1 Tax=Limulus polyphemus TaxID=6850 RepID=A0ABM1S182_LIMPO|nr:uncharacterized protein LOC111084962 [Limulus polyphemus]